MKNQTRNERDTKHLYTPYLFLKSIMLSSTSDAPQMEMTPALGNRGCDETKYITPEAINKVWILGTRCRKLNSVPVTIFTIS